jgi:hypothetical protein
VSDHASILGRNCAKSSQNLNGINGLERLLGFWPVSWDEGEREMPILIRKELYTHAL